MGNNIGPNYYEGMKKDIASCRESDPKKRADLCETKEHAGSLWDNYDAVQQNGSRLGEAFKTGREGTYKVVYDNGTTEYIDTETSSVFNGENNAMLHYTGSVMRLDAIGDIELSKDIDDARFRGSFEEGCRTIDMDDGKTVLVSPKEGTTEVFDKDGTLTFVRLPDIDLSNDKENPTGTKDLRSMSLNDLGKLKHEQKAVLKDLNAEAARLEAKAKDPNATQADIDAAKAARKAANDKAEYVYKVRHAYKDAQAKAAGKTTSKPEASNDKKVVVDDSKKDPTPKAAVPPEPGSEKERVGRHTFYNPM